jgi:NAD(P)H-hydrate repair Nnr-like enzyme with NAD(P)H-hydrate epimerase domain
VTTSQPALRPLLSREAVRAIDARIIARGIPGLLLMENAGRGAAEHIAARMAADALRRVVVLVGLGNNGGDGLVVARHLAARFADAQVRVVYVGDPAALRGGRGRDARRARRYGGALPHGLRK